MPLVTDELAHVLVRGFRAERARAGLSQAQLAERLGWSQSRITAIESGTRNLYAHELAEVCRALGVPLRMLLVMADPEDLAALGLAEHG